MNHRPDSGFTLIELLAALAVGSLLLVLLGGVLGQLRDGWRSSRDTAARVSEQAAGVARLQALVAAGLPADPQTKEIAFEGDDKHFRLRTLPPQAYAMMGVVWAEVSLDKSSDGLTYVQVRLSNERNTVPPQNVMASAEAMYFDYAMRDDGGVIHTVDRVGGSGHLPVAIHLQTRAGRTSAIRAMTLVPQNSVDGRCLFDPVSFACRL